MARNILIFADGRLLLLGHGPPSHFGRDGIMAIELKLNLYFYQ